MSTKKRYENDSFGKIAVPKDFLWGAQTQRSLNNFNIGTETFSNDFIKAFAMQKKACALANKDLKIQVKCNSALAETLMNEKRIEINKLEEKYSSKILFDFDNHYSLHEPVINEIENQKVTKINNKSSEKNL